VRGLKDGEYQLVPQVWLGCGLFAGSRQRVRNRLAITDLKDAQLLS
jgi:hypothetical protein